MRRSTVQSCYWAMNLVNHRINLLDFYFCAWALRDWDGWGCSLSIGLSHGCTVLGACSIICLFNDKGAFLMSPCFVLAVIIIFSLLISVWILSIHRWPPWKPNTKRVPGREHTTHASCRWLLFGLFLLSIQVKDLTVIDDANEHFCITESMACILQDSSWNVS